MGIRTVRDVIKAMASEGYITTVPGSHARDSYKAQGSMARLAEAERAGKDALYALMKTMEHVMPHIYARAAVYCDDELIQACRRDVAGIDGMGTKDKWRRSRAAFQRILTADGIG